MPEDSAEKCNAHVICHFNNSLLGTWHLSSKTLFRVPSKKKIFPNYIVKKVNAQLPENTKKCLNHPMPSLTMNLEDPLAQASFLKSSYFVPLTLFMVSICQHCPS